MFTGLIEDVGTVKQVHSQGGATGLVRMEVTPSTLKASELKKGESIAHAGVCLTVVAHGPTSYQVEIGKETLERSSAGRWRSGSRLNLERSMALGDRLGGHMVLGHVDAAARLLRRIETQGVLELWVELPGPLAGLVCEKGSIAIDGVSLTVNELPPGQLRVTLIPETVARTTLGSTPVGEPFNLEVDILGRHVARLLEVQGQLGATASPDTKKLLAEAGFLK